MKTPLIPYHAAATAVELLSFLHVKLLIQIQADQIGQILPDGNWDEA